jgi:hypothetical protein
VAFITTSTSDDPLAALRLPVGLQAGDALPDPVRVDARVRQADAHAIFAGEFSAEMIARAERHARLVQRVEAKRP